jgi:prophage antirepressor-like protein
MTTVFPGFVEFPYTFEGKTIHIVRHGDPAYWGDYIYASLGDLCAALGCSSPADVIQHLDTGVDILFDDRLDPGEALIPLEDGEDIGTVRSLSPDRDKAVRFRKWLIASVFPDFPDEHGLRIHDLSWWREQTQRTATRRAMIRLVD